MFVSPEVLHQIAALDGRQHLDAGETAMLERQLTFVETQTYDIQYAALKHRQFLPQDGSIPEGAESIMYRQFDQVGEAKFIANFADDLPAVDVLQREFPIPVKALGDSYSYSMRDLQHAAFSGVQLDTLRARVARDAVERKLDYVACFGEAPLGLKGFLNNDNVDIEAAGGAWASRTSEQIISDVHTLLNGIVEDTLELYEATDVLFPTELFQLLMTKPFSIGGGSDSTLLKFLQGNHPGVTFSSWTRLNSANADGDGGRIVAYAKNPAVVQEKVPMQFRQIPAQPKNLAFIVNCWALTAGVNIYQPKAVRYMDGAN